MKKILFLLVISIAAFCSCTDPYAADSTYIKDTSALPAASYLEQTDSLNASLWVELLKYADLYNTMNLAANYTCFVPNNDAMKAYLSKKGVTKVTDLSLSDAKTLVKYHTIKGAAYSAVSFEEGVISDTTATGDYLSTSFAENGGAVRINLEATITKTVKTNNAYVHILNSALTPVTETIWDKLQSSDFTIFRQAVEATGYKDKLNTISEVINSVAYKYHYTLFAVPDSVYKAKNITSLASLRDSLKAGSDYTASTNALNLYVAYHLFNQQVSYSSLAYFALTDTKRSKNYSTVAADQLLNVSEVNKVLYVNYNSTTKTGVKFLAVNRNCKNGVVHVMSGLMPVVIPKATTLQWELTDFSLMSSLLPKYRVSGLTTDYSYQLTSDLFTCYKWLSVPDTKPGLTYVITNKNNAVPYKALNYDYLRLNLGTYGWVEMTTPTIVAGTYKVTIEHYNPLAAQAQGKIWFIVDGTYFGSQIATQGASKTANQFLKTVVGTITFTTSTKHKVKILAADNYSSDLDCLTFTPQ
ncbi:fasciclin domain-containing protein [Parabacteroides sp. FAFU027]|uniref:fasciclin domain-containing protein n=1 Tax=Parabacteroides sp. FAFU027 TaxID=2922715 RepID=UPI001FB00960|nr:fasciclin domain-containing protein [Parabacteroides sp. FAFU027]